MHIIGCDFHTRFQQIAMIDCQTGEIIERRLDHEAGEAQKFYAALPGPARIGMEATGRTQWFERMLAEQGHELWVGDAAEIRAGVVRKQKTDARDACHILKLLLENRFPRIWVPSPGERDLRQLLQHRVRLVRFRTSVMNQLHALAMGQGLCRRKKLWTYYVRQGQVKLSVTSQQGKEAIVATLHAGDFFGEGCLAGQQLRIATAIAVTECTLMKIAKQTMTRMLHEQHEISELFVKHLLSRNIRFEGDLVDQLFNSSEKRLARILLLLARFGKESKSETILPKINQEHLSQMVGTTRSRVSHFLNKFRKLGFIDYKNDGNMTVNNGLLSVVLHD